MLDQHKVLFYDQQRKIRGFESFFDRKQRQIRRKPFFENEQADV